MPRLKRKSALQRKESTRSLMRESRVSKDRIDVDDRNDLSVANHGGSISDVGQDGLTDLNLSVPTTSVVRSSEAMGVCVLSDGGLARPTYSSALVDGSVLRPSVFVNASVFTSETSIENSTDIACNTVFDNCIQPDTKTVSNNGTEIVSGRRNANSCVEELFGDAIRIEISDGGNYAFTAKSIFDEEQSRNLRPFRSCSFITGSFNQAAAMFSKESRGSQCTAIALCSLIYAKYSEMNTREDLDKVLLDGDMLYKKFLCELKAQGLFKNRLLNLDEIPNVVSLLDKEIIIEKYDVISGVCTQQIATSCLPSLYQALYTAFQTSSHLLFIIGSVCSALFRKDDAYFFFDSHSHGPDGLLHPDGYSVLVSFDCLEDLVTFMYAVYDSMLIDLTAQFDMLPVNFVTVPTEKKNNTSCETIETDNTKPNKNQNVQQRKKSLYIADNEWHAVSNNRQTKSKHSAKKNLRDKMKVKTDRIDAVKSVKNLEQYQGHEKHVSLISRYFADQKCRAKYKEYNNDRNAERKTYHRMYKQKQRQSVAFKELERDVKRTARKSVDLIKKERDAKRTARESKESRLNERKISLKSKKMARESDNFKKKERDAKRTARESEESRLDERKISLKSKKLARQSDNFKKKERDAKRTTRESEESRLKEKKVSLKSKKKARESEKFKRKERDAKRSARKSDDSVLKEREHSLKSKRVARESDDFKKYENALKKRVRLVKEYRELESEKKRQHRKCSDFKLKELEYQRRSKRKARSNPYNLEKERLAKQYLRLKTRKKTSVNKTRKKTSVNLSSCEQTTFECNHSSKQTKYVNIDSCIKHFHKSISKGPIYICTCCHQTWFSESVSKVSINSSKLDSRFLSGKVSVDNFEWICTTCKSSLMAGKVPKLSIVNGMKWPDKPKELELHQLEERLIALRIPFMQLRELPRGRQYSMKGNIVNVPVEIQPVVNALPRPLDENVTVAVKLKKRMSHKSCAFTENVRPLRVLVALHWLMNHSKLYQNSDVEIDEQWIQHVTTESKEILQELVEQDHCHGETNILIPTGEKSTQKFDRQNSSEDDNVQYDSDEEENLHENVGNIDTLLDDENLENRTSTFTFAPGENQRPLSIFQDKDSEYLCFPTIFCGQRRKENDERSVAVHYSDIAKWELRSCDRRAANSVPNIFFKLKKIQMKQLNDKANLAIRKCQINGKTITAAEIRDSVCTDTIVKNNHGYYIFKQLRNSPAYLETRKKDVFAMIRQLGLPTWFISLSSADTRWMDLLKILAKLNDDETLEFTQNLFENLTWEQKIKLIQKDPVTCSRYFDHRVQQFIKIVLKSSHNPLGKITDYFYRVEFQQRGSPHIHMITWIENAPKYSADSIESITSFVDNYLQCSCDDKELGDLILLQIHKHSRTCKKKEDKLCRFGYPLPPLPRTMVLEPLETDIDKYRKMYAKLQRKMNEQKDGYDMNYQQFLANVVELTEEEYIKCIRSTLKTTKVFLQRKPKDIRVNLYNKTILKAWQANIDIQFIVDPYACAMYIVSYISKSQRGMSSLMHAACKEAKSGNFDIKQQVRHIGNVFSNSVEVSAQEAVYIVLQIPLSNSTRQVIFVNTSTPEKRIHLIKSKTVLDEMPGDSTDVIAENVIKRYAKRPKVLDNWCLADYVSRLDIEYPKNETAAEQDEEINDDDITGEDNEFDNNSTIITLRNGIKIKRRKNNRILRYVRFNKKSDEENHFREKLLLFHPWRNENSDLISNYDTYKDHYIAVKSIIDLKCEEYEHHVEELDIAREMVENDDYDAYDDLAPRTQQVEADTEEEEIVASEKFVYFNPDQIMAHQNYDIGLELSMSCSLPTVEPNAKLLSEQQYFQLLRSLNSKQKQFYNHVIHWIKTKDEPMYAFLSGGAGVGKSVVIRALYQTLYRIFNLKEGENPDDKRVLLCAFTGKAAFNIGGSTISSAFHVKFGTNQTLSCDTLNTFRSKYRNLSVIIIDEISMVSNKLLHLLDQRLQELTGTRLPFGGISIIAVGDLYQLQPVRGVWIFNDLTCGAAALATNLWKTFFKMFELTEVMRQKDDVGFTALLNRLRLNVLTDSDKEELKRCEITKESVDYPMNVPHLFAENYFMHNFNDQIIHYLTTEKVTIPCHDTVVSPTMSLANQNKLLTKLPKDPSCTANLHHSLVVVVSMTYDLTVNVNTEDGLANGASCVVKYIEYRQTNTNRPSIIWVEFNEPEIGAERRLQYHNRGFYSEHISDIWTPVFDVERTFNYGKWKTNATIQRIQFPLQPAAGRSVHRAQGSTLDKIVVDLSQQHTRKIAHLHYVALSRVRSIKNLHILNFNENALKVDEQVTVEMERLYKTATLDICYVPLDTIDATTHFKIAYNNCRSFHKHVEEIRQHQGILSAHVIGLSETRLGLKDQSTNYLIEGFNMIRNDHTMNNQSIRPSHGSVVFVRNDVNISKTRLFNSKELEISIIVCHHNLIEIQVVVVYKSPATSYQTLLKIFETELFPHVDKSKPLTIIGDFNIDSSKRNTKLEQIMQRLNCEQLIHKPTTDTGSSIDLVFTNCHGKTGTEETYWSDHKLVFFYT